MISFVMMPMRMVIKEINYRPITRESAKCARVRISIFLTVQVHRCENQSEQWGCEQNVVVITKLQYMNSNLYENKTR